MDFLDPNKQRAHMVRLIVGYILIGTAILIATIILLYQAFGFGLGKQGEVVQNGLVFVSSQPQGAQVYIDNKLYKDTTNTRFQLPEGDYAIEVRREGYISWKRRVEVTGGSVARYDYPLLVPQSLTPSPVRTYQTKPEFATASPDRRWLLVQQAGSAVGFDVYDVRDPKKIPDKLRSITLPASVVTASTAAGQSWKLTEWSTDNVRVVVEHAYNGGSEYILIDHQNPENSVNLTRALNLQPGQILSLRDKKYDRYYIFDPAAKSVAAAALSDTTPVPVLMGALAFKSYGSDMLLYATDVGATPGKALTMLKDGDVTYKIREIGGTGPYLLDLAQYSGDWFVAVSASGDNIAYVFKNPQAVRKAGKVQNLVPARLLRVTAPNYLAFSSNTQFIMLENGTNFAVYDAEMDKGYTYAAAAPLDAPQTHAAWMDGDRITYVSGGNVVIFDYDNINSRTLVPASSSYLPFFDRDYRYLYTITAPAPAAGQSTLAQTSLLTANDR